jgi:hypothetical protein
MNTDDPIVFPGQPGASHLHLFFGNTGTNAMSTRESMATTGNSTCRGGTIDRTGYWVPAIIDTATGTPLAPRQIDVYYKSGYGGVRPEQIQPMPPGLRMIAGNAKASSKQEHGGYWNCESDGGHHFPTIPQCAPGDSVEFNVLFPQCWDGKNLDSADHKSHMSYPVEGRGCPATHPVAIPDISYHLEYPMGAGTRTATWRLSSDMYDPKLPGGYSIHGDWFDGWKPAIVDAWIAGCVNKPVSCGSHMLGDGRVMNGDA